MFDVSARPLPNFDRWLTEQGHTARGGDIEAIGALTDLARRTAEQNPAPLSPDQASFLRMWAMLFAVVETCNIENEHGRSPAEITLMLPRVLGLAAIYAMASVVKDETPLRTVAKILTEEFRWGSKMGADTIRGGVDA